MLFMFADIVHIVHECIRHAQNAFYSGLSAVSEGYEVGKYSPYTKINYRCSATPPTISIVIKIYSFED